MQMQTQPDVFGPEGRICPPRVAEGNGIDGREERVLFRTGDIATTLTVPVANLKC